MMCTRQTKRETLSENYGDLKRALVIWEGKRVGTLLGGVYHKHVGNTYRYTIEEIICFFFDYEFK